MNCRYIIKTKVLIGVFDRMHGEDFKKGFLEGFRLGFQEKTRSEFAELFLESDGWEEPYPQDYENDILLEISMLLKKNEIIMERKSQLLKKELLKRGWGKISAEDLKGIDEL